MSQIHVLVEPGYIYQVVLPCSEVCMHMQVADKVMGVELLPNSAVQLWEKVDRGVWKRFSFPILSGEAGLYDIEDDSTNKRKCFYTDKSTQAFQRFCIGYSKKGDWPRGVEYSDGENWFNEKWLCRCCQEQCEAQNKPYKMADEQYSLGIYAGKYCEECWQQAGYRKEGMEGFNPADCGESYEEV